MTREKELEKALKELTLATGIFLRQLDKVMARPSTVERGKIIAELVNRLELARDKVRYSTLGIDYHHDPELKDGQRIMPKLNKPKGWG